MYTFTSGVKLFVSLL